MPSMPSMMGKAGDDEVIKTEPVKMPVPKKLDQIHKKEATISKSSDLLQTNFDRKMLNNEIGKVDTAVALTSCFSSGEELEE